MTTEFDVDTPADLELLGGDDAEETEEVPATEEPESKPDEEVIEQEPEAAEEEPQEEEEPAPKRDAVIPRARFDEVNAKLHAEREEVERLRAELAARTPQAQAEGAVDVEALEDKFFEAMMEGDKDTAKQVRATINAEIYARAQAASAAAVETTLAEREAKKDFSDAVTACVAAYPYLNSKSQDANPDAIAEVRGWRDYYIANGNTPANALLLAAQRIAPLYSVVTTQITPDTDKRKQTALATAARVAATQPPRVDAGVGNRAIPAGDSIVGNQDKWEKASEAERMRHLQ